MLLPEVPTSDWVRATALVSLAVLLVAALVLALLGAGVAAVVLLALAALSGVAACVPGPAKPLYRSGAKVVALFARLVRGVARLACFAVVTAAGTTSTSLVDDAGSRRSAWTTKTSVPPDSYANPFVLPGTRRRGWATGFVHWAVRSGNAWAVTLLPFLALVRSAQETDDHEVAGEIYALY